MKVIFWEDAIFSPRVIKLLCKHGLINSKDDLLSSKERLMSAIREKLAQLFNGECQSAGLDFKLQIGGIPISTLRLNKDARLVVAAIPLNGKPYLAIIDLILSHDYQKSLIENSPALRRFLENNKKNLEQQVMQEDTFQAMLSSLKEAQIGAEIEFIPATLCNDIFLIFNPHQQDALKATLPGLYIGAPGCGKTSIAYSLIVQALNQELHIQGQGLILHVTPRTHLAEGMQQAIKKAAPLINPDLGLHAETLLLSYKEIIEKGLDFNTAAVLFLTYEELFQLLDPRLKTLKQVGKKEFEGWLNHYKKITGEKNQSHKIKKSQASKNASFLDNWEQVYQELRIIGGCDNLEEYLQLGKNQCLFQDETQKRWLWTMVEAYLLFCSKNNLFNPEVYPLPQVQTRFCLILADEIQNFSRRQSNNLLSLSQGNFCAFGDSKQNTEDNLSTIPYLEQKMREQAKQNPALKPSFIHLPYTYRCAPNIAHLVNQTENQKRLLIGGVEQKNEPTEFQVAPQHFSDNPGVVQWLSSIEELAEEDRKQLVNTHCAIATPCVEKAKKDFPNVSLIFNSDQIIGQEFHTLIVYLPFEGIHGEEFVTANKYWIDNDLTEQTVPTHLPKKHEIDRTSFGPLLASLVIFYSRARERLIIIQEQRHEISALIEFQKQVITTIPKTLTKTLPQSTQQDWQQQYKKQLELKHYDIAKAIYDQHLSHLEPIAQASSSNQASSSTPSASLAASKKTVNRKQPYQFGTNPLPLFAKKTTAPLIIENKLSEDELFVRSKYNSGALEDLYVLFHHPRALTYLFEVPFTVKLHQKKQCLFFRYANNNGCANDVFKLLEDNFPLCSKLIRYFENHKNLWEELRQKVNSPNGKKLLEYLSPTNPLWLYEDLEEKISARIIANNKKRGATIEQVTIDFSKLGNEETFYDYISHEPTLTQVKDHLSLSSSGESLQAVKPLNERTMLQLATTENGLEIFQILHAYQRYTAASLTLSALSKRQESNDFYHGTSILFWLTASHIGREFLTTILNVSTHFLDKIDVKEIAEILCWRDPASPITATSIFYWLSACHYGIQALLHLEELKSGLLAAICLEVKKEPKKNQQRGTNRAALVLMASHEDGIELQKVVPSLNLSRLDLSFGNDFDFFLAPKKRTKSQKQPVASSSSTPS